MNGGAIWLKATAPGAGGKKKMSIAARDAPVAVKPPMSP
jgi:hypothetical protein